MADLITPGGIALLLDDPSSPPTVLQVLDIKRHGNRYTSIVTDGELKTKAMLPTDMVADVETGKIQDTGLLRVLGHTCNTIPNQALKGLIITHCEVVCATVSSEPSSVEKDPDTKPIAKLEGVSVLKSAAEIVKEQHGNAAPAGRMGISRRVYPLMSLSPYQGNWTIKVRVTSKGPLRSYRNARGEGNVFNVELTDEDGTQIQATMFKEAADKFYSKFQLGKVYYISKGVLRVANKQFSTVKNNYEMTLSTSSEVEEIEDDDKSAKIPSLKFNFIKIDKLAQFVNTKDLIDVIGVVQSVSSTVSVRRKSDNTEFPKREMTIVDQSEKTVVVSLWNTLASEEGAKLVDLSADAPVVMIRFVKTNDFQGVSLSTSNNSMVVINPDIPESHALRSWYDDVGKDASVTAVGAHRRRSLYDESERACIADMTLPSVGQGKPAYFNVRACLSYIKAEQPMWYMACVTCNKKVVSEDSSSTSYWCEACQLHSDKCNRRYIMSGKVTDASGEAWICAFNEEAENILGRKADELAEIRIKDDKAYGVELKGATWCHKVFRMSVAETEYMSEKRQRITIRSVHQPDWAAESRLLLDSISKNL